MPSTILDDARRGSSGSTSRADLMRRVAEDKRRFSVALRFCSQLLAKASRRCRGKSGKSDQSCFVAEFRNIFSLSLSLSLSLSDPRLSRASILGSGEKYSPSRNVGQRQREKSKAWRVTRKSRCRVTPAGRDIFVGMTERRLLTRLTE